MKAIFVIEKKHNIPRIYNDKIMQKISDICELDTNIYNKAEVEEKNSFADVEAIFTSWGMSVFTKEEVQKYFPKLKYIFYAGGSVQYFVKGFIESGVKVFSAFRANAIPVAEFTFAQIILANKGFHRLNTKKTIYKNQIKDYYCGNYGAKVGIVGCGAIGKIVAEKLKTINCKIYTYDPFLDKKYAEKNNIEIVDLKTLFATCDVITNHLADKVELTKVLNYDLFKSMKSYSTFINTGRGRQVDEKGLVKAFKEDRTKTALLDVTCPEPAHPLACITRQKNIIISPHIAGSLCNEVHRMGEYMYDAFKTSLENKKSEHEVTKEMLKTMA